MIQQALLFMFAMKVAFVSCNFENKQFESQKQRLKITRLGHLDKDVNESSGLSAAPWSEHLLTINDSGGEPVIYEMDHKGKLVDSHVVPGAKNKDWEEITTDNFGNVYIGDFGNNHSTRQDLKIYKYRNNSTEEIAFRFGDQAENPLKEYDCEAFFWLNDSLYLFTKSWEKGIKNSRLYAISDTPGTYTLWPKDQIALKAQITGAAVSPSAARFALISYGKIFLFKITASNINFQNPEACIKIAKKQTESIMFQNDSTLLFTNEQRSLFQLDLKSW